MLTTACQQLQTWQQQENKHLRLAVNVSSLQLQQDNFVDTVQSALNATGIPPNLLELEITESSMLQDINIMRAKLLQLKKLGVTIAIDDFGTGFSSLSYLKDLPVDIIKLDISFVRAIALNARDNLADVIIFLTHHLGLKVVAEGIETAQQLKYLQLLKCDIGQGFYFAKPVAINEFST